MHRRKSTKGDYYISLPLRNGQIIILIIVGELNRADIDMQNRRIHVQCTLYIIIQLKFSSVTPTMQWFPASFDYIVGVTEENFACFIALTIDVLVLFFFVFSTKILNIERSFRLTPGPQSSLVLPCKISLGGPAPHHERG